MRLPTNTNPTVVGSATTTKIIVTTLRAPRTTATKGRQPTTMAPKSSVNSALDPGKSSDNNLKAVGRTCKQPRLICRGSAHIDEIELEALAGSVLVGKTSQKGV